ncbi:hypothetical protein BKA67DRAFT_357676 [Truncatella angustata]|uniref:RRM domain-containing protein n=1 Tax=Truncatella angustata TaxID=152316 RepID=A0A9P8ZSW5_9PEZI|nr:uncharacterized protein BKA67DRAFT_357676 [Truncatella angustata]KAH6648246.1 hypothetical protein BKA67DRAFT_357676 [Truncatella angustata]
MDNFTPFNGQPPSNGSGSQGDGGSQGGMPPMPPNGQGGGDNAGSFQGGDASRQTLWMGELAGWMDEQFIRSIFLSSMNENVQVKIIRDRHSGNAGYCFVEFSTPEAAAKALQLNGSPVPNTDRVFRLNWASGGGLVDRRDDRSPEYSIFVGDLGHEVNEFVLVALFQARFPSCKSAKIMTDQQTGQSRGYGFVRFSNEQDQQRALVEMQGVYCGNRPMRGGQFQQFGGQQMMPPAAVPPQGMGAPWMQQQQQQPQAFGGYQQQQPGGAGFNPMVMNQFTDPNNTTVFVGGLSGYVTEDELRSFFQGFGEITYVKIPPGKGCGFVQFVHRHAAEMAINQMQGYPIGNSRVRLSWGRSQNNSG